jgi:hypothetical protein
VAEYQIGFAKSAQKQLQAAERALALRVIGRIESLAVTPRPAGCVKLEGGAAFGAFVSANYRACQARAAPALRDLLLVVDHDVVVRDTRCAGALAAQREQLAILGNGASGRPDHFAALFLCALDRVVIDLFQRQAVEVG